MFKIFLKEKELLINQKMKDFLMLTDGKKSSIFWWESINIKTEEVDKFVSIGQCVKLWFNRQELRVAWCQINYW